MSTPGTYRQQDGSEVAFKDALHAWSEAAHPELRWTATRYGRVITYRELAELVQSRSGVRTRMLMMHWIGAVLERVARRCAREGEPPLTSLCMHQDGTIGDGYAKAAAAHFGEDVGEDIEMYAAAHRLRCYRAYADDLPADGGSPMLTEQVAERRTRNKNRNKTQSGLRQPQICPTCRMTLPASGICDDCGSGPSSSMGSDELTVV